MKLLMDGERRVMTGEDGLGIEVIEVWEED